MREPRLFTIEIERLAAELPGMDNGWQFVKCLLFFENLKKFFESVKKVEELKGV